MKKFDLSNIFNVKGKSARHKIINQFGLDKYDKRAFLNNLEELEKKAESSGGESGGESGLIEKDCNFYDYDGTLLYSYTAEEAMMLTELPIPPQHEDFITDGWNQSLEGIKIFNGKLDVGAQYKSKYYGIFDINIDDDKFLTIPLYLKNSTNGNQIRTIDWGDGNLQEINLSSTQKLTITHTYNQKGLYRIKLTQQITSNNTYETQVIYYESKHTSFKDTSYGIFGNVKLNKNYYDLVVFCDNTIIQPFFKNIKNIIYYSNVRKDIDYSFFRGDGYFDKIKFISYPITTIYTVLYGTKNVEKIILGENQNSYGTSVTFNNIKKLYLNNFYISRSYPFSITSIKELYVYKGDVSFSKLGSCKIFILNGTTNFPYNIADFGDLNVYFPSSITNIGQLSKGTGVKFGRMKLYLNKITTVPIKDGNYISYEYYDVYINKHLYYDFINATNWSQKSKYIKVVDEDVNYFIINTKGTYVTKRNLTWKEWINSEDYYGNYSIVNGVVMSDDVNNVQANGANVLETDIIISDYEYTILINQ